MKKGEILETFYALEHIKQNKDIQLDLDVVNILYDDMQKLRPIACEILDARARHMVNTVLNIKTDEINQSIESLMEEEVEIELQKIPIDRFGGIKLSVEDAIGLLHILDIGEIK